MDQRLIYLVNTLKVIKRKFSDNEAIWYELRDANEPNTKPTSDIRNGRRDKATYDHIQDVLMLELEILKLEIELFRMGYTSTSILESMKKNTDDLIVKEGGS